MKILIMCLGGPSFDEKSLITGGVGGSETWFIELANAFKNLGHEVTAVCGCNTHYASNGILYVALEETQTLLAHNKFDLCIVSRFHSNALEVIDIYKSCDNVFIQAHDTSIYGDDIKKTTQFPCFKGVSTLSAYQERCLHDKLGVDWKYMVRIGNGINPKDFNDIDFTPQNKRILFSSCYDRGGEILKDSIIPKLTKTIKDSGVDFCTYSPIQMENNKDIQFIGSLKKHELYEEMGKRYCWFYPSTFDETFCITMIENIMCENDLVVPLTYGLSSVIEPYVNDVSMQHVFGDDKTEFSLAVDEAVDRIKTSILDHDKGKELRAELKNYVLSNHTWDIVAKKWLKLV